jgi:hypothetical protein
MWEFIKKHWAASLALLLAILTTGIIVYLCMTNPAVLVLFTSFSLFGFSPLSFLATMTPSAANAALGAIIFTASLAGSALFNAVVAVYNALDRLISPEPKPSLFDELIEEEDGEEVSLERSNKGNSSWVFFWRMLGLECCIDGKKVEYVPLRNGRKPITNPPPVEETSPHSAFYHGR